MKKFLLMVIATITLMSSCQKEECDHSERYIYEDVYYGMHGCVAEEWLKDYGNVTFTGNQEYAIQLLKSGDNKVVNVYMSSVEPMNLTKARYEHDMAIEHFEHHEAKVELRELEINNGTYRVVILLSPMN